jgi:predicted amidohydrolase
MLNLGSRRGAAYEEIAEELRGPTYQLLARKAREYGTYVLGCIYERDGALLFNTAFLLDRAGELAGTYRKVHLYWPEEREGISPGDAFPVFDADFGRVGVMICYDSWFPEAARILGLQGAEVLLFPSAGYGEEQVLARPGDNAAYLVASAMNSPALIAAPDGRVLARTAVNGVVVATVDLADRGTAHPNAGGTLNASPGGRLASRHAPSLRLYEEMLARTRDHLSPY